eukprot:TRINITY_DN19918_c2_g1_i4.p1 TRINITY_DN19918_c2_g1~~TRINITY_DN19918_c2_g1_i4.p1  ORF type:complete len:374 (+),score=69.65 TRINITY_DN19918_c2_g1_i4:117-1238(+)
MKVAHQVTVPVSGVGITGLDGCHTGEHLLIKRIDECEVVPLRKGCGGMKLKSSAVCVISDDDVCSSFVVSLVRVEDCGNKFETFAYSINEGQWKNEKIQYRSFSNELLSSSATAPTQLHLHKTSYSDPQISVITSFNLLCVITDGTAAVFEYSYNPETGGLLQLKWQVACTEIQPNESPPALTPKYLIVGIQSEILVSYVANGATKSCRHLIESADSFNQFSCLSSSKILALTASGLLFILSLAMPFKMNPSVLQLLAPTDSRITRIAAFSTFLEPFVPTSNCLGAFACDNGTIMYCQLGRLLSSAGRLTRTRVGGDVEDPHQQDGASAPITAEQIAYVGSEVQSLTMSPPQCVFFTLDDPPRLQVAVLPAPP